MVNLWLWRFSNFADVFLKGPVSFPAALAPTLAHEGTHPIAC